MKTESQINSIQELFSFLLNLPQADQQSPTGSFISPVEIKNTNLEKLLSSENFEKISLDNDSLEKYANYMLKTCFIRENEFKFDHRAYAYGVYYYLQDENYRKIFSALKERTPPSSEQDIVDLTTAILLQSRFKDKFLTLGTRRLNTTSTGDFKDLLKYLLDPKTVRLHHLDEKIVTTTNSSSHYNAKALTLTFNFPEGKKEISLRPDLFYENLKNISIDNDLLDSYVKYMDQVCLVKETEFNFEHRAYNYAAHYYLEDNNFQRIDRTLYQSLSNSSPYKFKIERVENLEELKELKNSIENHFDIYIIIVHPNNNPLILPKVYCSQLGKDLSKSNLIPLHHKIIIQNWLQYLTDPDLEAIFIKKIEDILKIYFDINTTSFTQLTEQSIVDLTTQIILKNRSWKPYDYCFADNLKDNYRVKKSLKETKPANSNDAQKLLTYLLDSKLVKFHSIDKDLMTVTFHLKNNTTDVVSFKNLYTVENIDALSIDNDLLEHYANYITQEFFIRESEFTFDHRGYSCAASYADQQIYFNSIMDQILYLADSYGRSTSFIKVRGIHFEEVSHLEKINELKINPDHHGDVYVIFVKPNSSVGITEIYCSQIEVSLSFGKLIKLHHKIGFQQYFDILNYGNLMERTNCRSEIANKLKIYFSLKNQYRFTDLSISYLVTAIILKHGLKGKKLNEYRSAKIGAKVFSEIGNEQHIQKLLTYLLNPKLVKLHSFNEYDLTVTLHLPENKEESIPLQCLFSAKNLSKLPIEESDLNAYVYFMERIRKAAFYTNSFKSHHLAYQYAVSHYITIDSYKINKLLRTNNFEFKVTQKSRNYKFIHLETKDLNELDYPSLESKKNNNIYIIIVNNAQGNIELYCSPFEGVISKGNLINLNQKFYVKKYINEHPDIKSKEEKWFLLINIEEQLISSLRGTIKTFSDDTISYIATFIILSHLLNSSKIESQDGYRLNVWDEEHPLSLGHFLPEYVAQDRAFLSFSRPDGSLFYSSSYNPEKYYSYIYSKNTPGLSIWPESQLDEILVAPRKKARYRYLGMIDKCTFYRATFTEQKQRNTALKRPSEPIQKFFIEYLMRNFFSKEYEDASLCPYGLAWRDAGGSLIVYKPNHGIMHTIRQSENILYLFQTFAVIISLIDFVQFCIDVVNKETIWVLGEEVETQHLVNEFYLVSGSSAIGRESELSFDSNKTKYQEYRRNSMIRFEKFAEALEHAHNFKISEKRLNIYKDVLEKLGDPGYMKGLTGFHLWVMQLVNTAHILDVARCFSAKVVEDILLDRLGPILKGSAQEHIKKLISFSVAWLQVTGDCIGEGYSINGYPIKSRSEYDRRFSLYSTTQLASCIDVLRTSPTIVFSSEDESKQDREAMEKIAEHFFATLLKKHGRIENRQAILKNLEILIKNIANLSYVIPDTLRNYLFEILLRKLMPEISQKPVEECTKALIAASEEKHISARTVQSLLEAKISPELKNNNKSPLMQAASTSGNEQVEKVKLLLEYKGDPHSLNWDKIVDNNPKRESTAIVDLGTQLTVKGHPKLLNTFLDSPQGIIERIGWNTDAKESKGNSLFAFTLSLIEKKLLSAHYLEKLLYPALLQQLKWTPELIKFFGAFLVQGLLECDKALSKLSVKELNSLQLRFKDLSDSNATSYLKFLIDLKSENKLSPEALRFKESNSIRSSTLYFFVGSQLSRLDYYREVSKASEFYHEAQLKLGSAHTL